MTAQKPKDISEYISGFPPEIQEKLEEIRSIIHSTAPGAKEVISYGMPAFRQKRILVYFAAHKKHLGFYPTGSGISAFTEYLSDYQYSKGAIQFPYERPLPTELIQKIVSYRVSEDLNRK